MNLNDFDYNLPQELIAQEPTKPRDHSRLLILNKITEKIEHKKFIDLPDYLESGDLLIFNNSKVFPARLLGQKKLTGGKIEVFLLKKELSKKNSEIWQCLLGGGKPKIDLEIIFNKKLQAQVIKNNEDSTWQVEFNLTGKNLMEQINKIGLMPLPPYIKNNKNSKNDYQTIYASDKKIGSVAAPTAGLHFTKRLLTKLNKQGVRTAYITLHVGLGTFLPVKTNDLTKHKMHAEWVEVPREVIKSILRTKKDGHKVYAVGTTVARSLEAYLQKLKIENCLKIRKLKIENYSDWVNIFIYPPYKFKVIDGLITNFHLPKSTLLMLVSALAGKKTIDKAYQEAIKGKYKFYSYGDGMLIK